MGENVAFILGYTGATGKAVVQELAKSDYFKKIVLVGRRKCDLPVGADDRFVQETVDYDNIGEYSHVFKDCTVGYCCLGCTNITSPDAEFTRIDRDYVLNTARVAREAGCRQFHVVTAVNTNINSRIHYRKVKGEAEEGLKEMGFPKLTIYRPGFIRARRQGVVTLLTLSINVSYTHGYSAVVKDQVYNGGGNSEGYVVQNTKSVREQYRNDGKY